MQLNIEKIKNEMKRLGINQSDMAEGMKCTRQHISYLLSGECFPRFKTVDQLANYFGMDPKDLIK